MIELPVTLDQCGDGFSKYLTLTSTYVRRSMLKKYRGKPVTIEAVQLTESNRAEIIKHFGEHNFVLKAWDTRNLMIHNEHSDVLAEPGDWIIKGPRNELYTCKDETFQQKYELVKSV